MRRSGQDVIAVVCLLFAIVCWGVPPIMLRYLTRCVPDGFTTNLVRYPISTIVYIPLLIAAHRRGVRMGSFWKWALLPSAINVIGQTLFAIAPYHMGAGIMSFLLRLSTIWSIVLALILFRDERPLARNPQFWFATVLAIVGFVMMVLMPGGDFAIGLTGVLIVLICSVFWGLYDVTVRHTMGSLHPLLVFAVIGNYTSIGLIPLGALGRPSALVDLTGAQWLLLVASAYIGIGMAHGSYYFALQRLGVAVSSVTLLLSPFVTIVGSVLLLDEHLTSRQWLGGALLITGAVLALWTRFQTKRIQADEEAAASSPD